MSILTICDLKGSDVGAGEAPIRDPELMACDDMDSAASDKVNILGLAVIETALTA